MRRARVVVTVLLTVAVAAGCASRPAASQDHHDDIGVNSAPPYTGPAEPGLATASSWSEPGETITELLGVGDSFVGLTSTAAGGHRLVVIDSSSGKVLHAATVPEMPEPIWAASMRLDTYQGKPVAVVQYSGQFAGNGLQGPSSGIAEIVVDPTGTQVWASTSGDGPYYIGGYLTDKNVPVSGMQGAGATSVESLTGAPLVSFTQGPMNNEYGATGSTLFVSSPDLDAGSSALQAIDVSHSGAVKWSGLSGEYLEVLHNDTVLTEQTHYLAWSTTGTAAVRLRNADSGAILGTSSGTAFDCEHSVIDGGSHTVICLPQPWTGNITAISLRDGKILWQQHTTRLFATGTAAGGSVYLETADSNLPGQQPTFVTLQEWTVPDLVDTRS